MFKRFYLFLLLIIFSSVNSAFALNFECDEQGCISEFETVKSAKYFSGAIINGHFDATDQYVQFKFADGTLSEWIFLYHHVDSKDHPHHDHSPIDEDSDHSHIEEHVIHADEDHLHDNLHEHDLELDLAEHERSEMLINTKTATALRFKSERPVSDLDYELIGLVNELPKNLLAGNEFSGLNIISRKTWGGFEKENNRLKLVASRNFLPNFSEFYSKEDPEISQVIGFMDDKTLLWPRQYAQDVKMLVIHHTASTREIDDPMQAIKNIHEYHANGKNWGDIGYHYIISPDGKIFEGRAGGAGVIGGHSYNVNKVSIGVALMGNYQVDQVPSETMRSLAMLLEKLSNAYDLDPLGKVTYKDQTFDVINGHRDSGRTLCPGENLYQRIPELRSWVNNNLSLNPKAFSLESENNFEIQALKREKIRLDLKNLTTQQWRRNQTKLVAADIQTQNIIGKNNSFRLIDSSVGTNSTGQFEIDLTSPNLAGFKALRFKLSHNGAEYSDDVFVNLIIKAKELSYKFGSKSSRVSTRSGQKSSIKLKVTNDSELDFDSKNPVYLAILNTDSSHDIVKINSNQLRLRSGKSTSLNLDLVAPTETGVFTQKIGLISPELGVLDGSAAEIVLNVSNASTSRARAMQYEHYYKVGVNEWTEFKIPIPNNTQETWYRDKFRTGHVKDYNTFITKPKILESSVRPGQTATLQFKLRTDTALPHTLMLRFVHNQKVIYSKFVRVFINQNGAKETKRRETLSQSSVKSNSSASQANNVSISKTTTTTSSPSKVLAVNPGVIDSTEPIVRVHITGASLDKYRITCNSDFISNLGGLQKHAAGKVLDMNIRNANQDIARFEPIGDGVCTVLNLERRPGWNQNLNDNSFRGNLEVRFDEGKAILINEIALEDYMKGLGEVSESSHIQKAQTIMVAARSYAYHYAVDGVKFPGKPYHLNDDPNSTQKYIGYGMELRSPTITKAVEQTAGQVVSFDKKAIKVPYFNQSAGFTKSAKQVWGWNNTPYLKGVSDPYCKQTSFLGHGVGISGCGASQMAKEGFDFEQIIKYYLPGVEIRKIY